MTEVYWDRLEVLSRAAMRTITGLPRLTLIPQLQAEAQLNTLDETVHQRRSARLLKRRLVLEVADLAAYMGQPPEMMPAFPATRPPSFYHQAVDNKF